MYPIPEAYARTVVGVWGERGAAWLRALPATIDECARRWGLQVGPHFEPLSYNYVAPATLADGESVVLKLGVPDRDFVSGLEALRLYDGAGMARLLHADAERGAMVMERLVPGLTLQTLDDDRQRTSIAAEVLRRLWRPAPADHPFILLGDWFEGLARLRQRFDGGTGPFDARLVAEAEENARELLASTREPMLLHGDFHHLNVLSAQRQPWLAIDPKGVVGDPAYELGAFLYNALPDYPVGGELRRILAQRVDQLADELPLPRERILGWGIAQAVLSGWWSYEEAEEGYEPVMEVAATLSAIQHGHVG